MRKLMLLPFLIFAIAGCKAAEEPNQKAMPLNHAEERDLQKFTEDFNEAMILAGGNNFIYASAGKRLPDEIQQRRNACDESANGQKVGPKNCPFWSEWSARLIAAYLEEYNFEMQIHDRNFQELVNFSRVKFLKNSLRSVRRRGEVVSTVNVLATPRRGAEVEIHAEFSGNGTDLGAFTYTINIEMNGTYIEAEFNSADNFGYINGKPYLAADFERLIPILRFY